MEKSKDKTSRPPALKRWMGGRPWGRYLALVAALAWMFVLGLLVGRGTAPVRFDLDSLTRELTALKEAEIRQEAQRVKNDAAAAGQKTDLEFYEALKKTPAAPRPAAKTARPQKKAAVQRKIAKPAVQKPPNKSAADGKGALTIQAASLRDRDAAETLVRKLKAKGYPAFTSIARIPERGTWFRVRVGRYAGGQDAGAVMQKLKSEGFDPLLVRQD